MTHKMMILPTLAVLAGAVIACGPAARAAENSAPSKQTESSKQAERSAECGKNVPAALAFKVKTLAGKEVCLGKYQGKVVLVVNVASKCGFTPQYKQLERLYEKYGERGLAVLGFPCNQFGAQEPGSADEIRSFCQKNYGVTFDMFAKVNVNGDEACDLYKHLTSLETKPKGPGKISWNFEKFLVGRNGEVVARFASATRPDDPEVVKRIEAELEKR
jgi:glutathione peroxidase